MKGEFATSSDIAKRLPNANEETQGFPTGPQDIDLYNGLIHAFGQEIRNVITAGGVTPSNGSTSQLLAGINGLIAAATGVGDTSQFLLMSQARSRMPTWPVVLTSDGRCNITSPGSGQARLPADVEFIHRGVASLTTVQTDFTLYPNRTYHVRWSYADGWAAYDLSDVDYNPSALLENDAAFDTTYDDMLVARLVTDATNAVTITNLANSTNLFHKVTKTKELTNSGAAWETLSGTAVAINWGRTPIDYGVYLEGVHGNQSVNSEWVASHGLLGKASIRETTLDRYGAADIEYLYDDSQGNQGAARFTSRFLAV